MSETRLLGLIPKRSIVVEPAEIIEALDPRGVAQAVLGNQHVVDEIHARYPSILVIDRIQFNGDGAAVAAPYHPAAESIRLLVYRHNSARRTRGAAGGGHLLGLRMDLGILLADSLQRVIEHSW